MLTAAELASMRSEAATALPGTAVISTQAWVSDGGGGGTTTPTPAGTVDCRLTPMAADEQEQGDRISAAAQYLITLPSDATITVDDRITIDSIDFNVEAIRDRSWNLTTRVEANKET